VPGFPDQKEKPGLGDQIGPILKEESGAGIFPTPRFSSFPAGLNQFSRTVLQFERERQAGGCRETAARFLQEFEGFNVQFVKIEILKVPAGVGRGRAEKSISDHDPRVQQHPGDQRTA
jgi:hypothetical protein